MKDARFVKGTFTSAKAQCFSRYHYDEPDTVRINNTKLFHFIFFYFFILELAITRIWIFPIDDQSSGGRVRADHKSTNT